MTHGHRHGTGHVRVRRESRGSRWRQWALPLLGASGLLLSNNHEGTQEPQRSRDPSANAQDRMLANSMSRGGRASGFASGGELRGEAWVLTQTLLLCDSGGIAQCLCAAALHRVAEAARRPGSHSLLLSSPSALWLHLLGLFPRVSRFCAGASKGDRVVGKTPSARALGQGGPWRALAVHWM